MEAVVGFVRDVINPPNVLVVGALYRQPKGATPVISAYGLSWGKECPRIQMGNSKDLRFEIKLIRGATEVELANGVYANYADWRVLRVKVKGTGGDERVLVSVTSVAKRLGISKATILSASNGGTLERLIAKESLNP